MTNRVGVQPGVKYGVELIRQTEKGQTIVDTYVYDEVLNLGEHSSVHKIVNYMPPADLSGEFSLMLVSKNTSGFLFGLADLGKVQLKSSPINSIIIDTSSCYLTVEGEKGSLRYTPLSGVDIAPLENLQSNCIVENTSSTSISVVPSFVTRIYSSFGDIVGTEGGDTHSIMLSPHEKKAIMTVLPKSAIPQAYVVAVKYGETSNEISYQYIVQGGGGMIKSFLFDKDNYEKGETAHLSFVWSPSLDTFPSSRKGTSTPLVSPTFTIMLTDERGNSCATPIVKELENVMRIDSDVAISSSCVHPKASVVLRDVHLGVFAEKLFDTSTTTPQKAAPSKINSLSIIVAVLALLCILVVLMIVRKKRAELTPQAVPVIPVVPATPTIPVIPLVLLMLLVVFGGAQRAWADTFTFPMYDGYHYASGVINLNKSSYSPGESISASASITSNFCTGNEGGVDATTNGSYIILARTWGACSASGSGSLTAPATPGSYSVDFLAYWNISSDGMGSGSYSDSGGGSISYTVSVPPPTPSVNINFSLLLEKAKIFSVNLTKTFVDTVFAETVK